MEIDPRFEYGVAPKSKADYAFLLHDLYHLRNDGIMCIVLPHGVLFRGGEEGEIRKNLVEHRHIQAIIGLPANIFFGTGIPTIIMVLRKERPVDDGKVLIVDASKHFIKEGKNNKLQASDIKRIVDAVTSSSNIEGFSRMVSIEEIRENDYNLNIPRYVDSSEAPESWDIFATMFGGIPKDEVDALSEYWTTWPSLKTQLFSDHGGSCFQACSSNISDTVTANADVEAFVNDFNQAIADLPSVMDNLVSAPESIDVIAEEDVLATSIQERLAGVPLVDGYDAYQILDDSWRGISIDLEIIQTEGFNAVRAVDPNMIVKKEKGESVEVQDGWVGRILPFELIQKEILFEDTESLKIKENRKLVIASEFEEILGDMDEEELSSSAINDSNDGFVEKELKSLIAEAFEGVSSPEIVELKRYLQMLGGKPKKAEKLQFIQEAINVDWRAIEESKDGTYSKRNVENRIKQLQAQIGFVEDSFESKLLRAQKLLIEEKELNKAIKEERKALHEKTKSTIENLTKDDCLNLLEAKWIKPLMSDLKKLPQQILDTFVEKIRALYAKYETTYADICDQIDTAESELSSMLGDLTGNEFDMAGIAELKKLLGGE